MELVRSATVAIGVTALSSVRFLVVLRTSGAFERVLPGGGVVWETLGGG